jgi:hypothetical protein
MTANALREKLQTRPFRGFGLLTADGDLLPVPHPEFISINPVDKRTVVVWRNEGPFVIDLELVTKLEPVNGKRRWRRR